MSKCYSCPLKAHYALCTWTWNLQAGMLVTSAVTTVLTPAQGAGKTQIFTDDNKYF